MFWGQTALIGVMFVTGLVIWNTYFGGLTSIETQRWALLAHSLAAGHGVNPLGDEVRDALPPWWGAGPCVPAGERS